ncbi:MAG TPA: hypothetical protein VJQ57_13965 [Acidimicrobiia bacterium]|nr:hypothetical protein [Acidimicrobiia bacterium]
MQYLKRLVELALVAFLAAAVPVFTEQGASKAGVSAAVAAGLAAVYGLLVKGLGDKDRPSAL